MKRSRHILDAIMSIFVWIAIAAIIVVLGTAALVWAIVDSLVTIIFKRNTERLCWL